MTLPEKRRAAAGEAAALRGDLLAGDQFDSTSGAAEAAVVGAVVFAATEIQDLVLKLVTDTDFAEPRSRFVIGVVRQMRAEGLPVDALTVIGYVARHARLEAGKPRVALATWLHETIDAAPVPASAAYYAGMVVEAAARRRAVEAAQRIAAAAEGGPLADLQTIVSDELAAVTAAVARVGGQHV